MTIKFELKDSKDGEQYLMLIIKEEHAKAYKTAHPSEVSMVDVPSNFAWFGAEKGDMFVSVKTYWDGLLEEPNFDECVKFVDVNIQSMNEESTFYDIAHCALEFAIGCNCKVNTAIIKLGPSALQEIVNTHGSKAFFSDDMVIQ